MEWIFVCPFGDFAPQRIYRFLIFSDFLKWNRYITVIFESQGRGKFKRLGAFDYGSMLYALSLYRPNPVVVEIGSGDGTYARTLGSCSEIQIFTYDMLPLPGAGEMENIHHFCQRVEELTDFQIGHLIDVFVGNRILHSLPFKEAVRLLTILRKNVAPSTFRGFIILSGLSSPLARNYQHSSLSVQDRFCRLNPKISEKYEINEPVCLYTIDDAAALIEAGGFRPISVSCSHFGNVRAIFQV